MMSEPSDSDAPTPDTPAAILEDQLDEADYRIFQALNENGRMSDTELADRVNLSRTAVRRRRENLMDSGFLRVLAVIVLQEAGLAYADVRIELDQSVGAADRDALIEMLIDADLIYTLHSCIGDYDLLVQTWHASLNDLKSYVWDLLDDQPAVASYDLTPVVKTWKAWDQELDRPSNN